MVKLSLGQRKLSAEILGNIAVGWFIAGVITPALTGSKDIYDLAPLVFSGLLMTIFFSFTALYLVRKVKS